MASEMGQHGSSGGESALLRFFLPGLVVGTVLGSMLGLYVGTRSGGTVMPDLKASGPAVSGAPTNDERVEPSSPAETTPAEKPAETPAEPKPAEEKPAEKPAGTTP